MTLFVIYYAISGHSTHFYVGGDNPKVKGKEFFSCIPQGPVKGHFPNEKYSKIMQK